MCTLLILSAATVFTIVPFGLLTSKVTLALFAMLFFFACLLRCVPAFEISFYVLASTGALLIKALTWPLPSVVALALLLLLTAVASKPRHAPIWLRKGDLKVETWQWIAAIALVSVLALVLWQRLAHPDLAHAISLLPNLPIWGIVLAGLTYVVVNAAAEEFVYRGILMSALDRVFGPTWLPVALQAVVFGVWHLHGIPSGPMGVALAGIYGAMLGTLRRHSDGILAPVIAHIFADLTILSIVLTVASGH